MTQLSVVIPTHKRISSLSSLLESLKNQNLDNHNSFEVLVISNLDDRQCEVLVAKYKKSLNIFYHFTGSLGVNRARNLGLKKAKSPLIYFLDDDCELPNSRHLQELIKLHNEHPLALCIGGPYSLASKTGVIDRAYHINAHFWLEQANLSEGNTQLLGGNMSFKTERLSPQMRFNENIFFGGTESELFSRLSAAGEKILFTNQLKVQHKAHLKLSGFLYRGFCQGKGRFKNDFLTAKETNCDIDLISSTTPEAILLILYSFAFRLGYRYENSYPFEKFSFLKLPGVIYCELFRTNALPQIQSLHESEINPQPMNSKIYKIRSLIFKIKNQLSRPINWLKANFWRLNIPYHQLKLHVWKIKIPMHQLKIKSISFFWFIYGNLWRLKILLWPIRKIYWMLEYQYNKRLTKTHQ